MELTSFVFPSSKSSYTYSSFPNNLLFIPRTPIISGKSNFSIPAHYSENEPKQIPCLYIRCEGGSSKILLYFHGNAEDIGETCTFMELLSLYLGVHVIVMEYPSYGIYAGVPNETRIIEDCTNVFDYLTQKVGWRSDNIILAGRSIGSGPAIYLASCKKVAALLLISAYTSVKAAAKNIAGSFLQILVKDRFNNKELISNVVCPSFMLHGQKDTIVPYSHSQQLLAGCKGPCMLHMPEEMDHSAINYVADLCKPFSEFLRKCGVSTKSSKEVNEPNFPDDVFKLPSEYPKVEEPGMLKKFVLKLF